MLPTPQWKPSQFAIGRRVGHLQHSLVAGLLKAPSAAARMNQQGIAHQAHQQRERNCILIRPPSMALKKIVQHFGPGHEPKQRPHRLRQRQAIQEFLLKAIHGLHSLV
jgi:hypothetical protein